MLDAPRRRRWVARVERPTWAMGKAGAAAGRGCVAARWNAASGRLSAPMLARKRRGRIEAHARIEPRLEVARKRHVESRSTEAKHALASVRVDGHGHHKLRQVWAPSNSSSSSHARRVQGRCAAPRASLMLCEVDQPIGTMASVEVLACASMSSSYLKRTRGCSRTGASLVHRPPSANTVM